MCVHYDTVREVNNSANIILSVTYHIGWQISALWRYFSLFFSLLKLMHTIYASLESFTVASLCPTFA